MFRLRSDRPFGFGRQPKSQTLRRFETSHHLVLSIVRVGRLMGCRCAVSGNGFAWTHDAALWVRRYLRVDEVESIELRSRIGRRDRFRTANDDDIVIAASTTSRRCQGKTPTVRERQLQ